MVIRGIKERDVGIENAFKIKIWRVAKDLKIISRIISHALGFSKNVEEKGFDVILKSNVVLQELWRFRRGVILVEFTENMRKNNFCTKNCNFIHFSSLFLHGIGCSGFVCASYLHNIVLQLPHLSLDDLRITEKHGENIWMQKNTVNCWTMAKSLPPFPFGFVRKLWWNSPSMLVKMGVWVLMGFDVK